MFIEAINSEIRLIRSLANLSSASEIVQHEGGWDSRVYGFDNDRYFFKFPRTDRVKQTYANEIAALKLASTLGVEVKVPKVIWEHPGNAYFGYEGVPGVPLNAVSQGLDKQEKQSIGTALGEFLKRFHQCELKDVLAVDASKEVAQLQKWYEDVLPVIEELCTESEHQRLEKMIFEGIPTKIEAFGSNMRLGHGDLAGWNIIYDADGRVGVIDFGKVCRSDPSRDLIYIGDQVIMEYSIQAYGDSVELRNKADARMLFPEINSLMYYSGKGNNMEVTKTAVRIRKFVSEII